ncbi:C-type lectin domain family 2 member E-like isoform X2 [Dermochelys coriacea]|uniref:C-type lectin domain family 2 member E-like isoform X2 n=1 Tax=Dermochelys coriacea TaxID=27794 RepID=UPI001CA88E1E|nr:C-type lectin domain family 2 member E-like isoform X2 [Dermochelys coriacea]
MSVQTAVSWGSGAVTLRRPGKAGKGAEIQQPPDRHREPGSEGERLEHPWVETEAAACTGDGRSCRLRKHAACTVAVSVVLVILIVAVVTLAVLVLKTQPQFMAWCPDGWIGYRGKCYYFSVAEENWNNSQRRCSALGASLALIDSNQDLPFMIRYKGISKHWIGLWREQVGQPWKWVNDSDLNIPFLIRGGGDCAYLNNKSISSSRCINERNWVCSKPDAYTNTTQRSQELKSLTTGY